MTAPKVRIVMPVYNSAAYVAAGIESVLKQDEPHWELQIVDDGSQDASADICRRYAQKDSRIHFTQQQNAGQYGIVNRYTAAETAEYSAVLDSDDQLAPDYLSSMCQFAQKHDCDIVLTTQQVLKSRKYFHKHKRQLYEDSLTLKYLHGVFSMPDCGIFVRSALRCQIAPRLPQLPLYAATDDLQGFFLTEGAQRIGHMGAAKYWRNFSSAGTWRNHNPEFLLRKVYSILFSLSYIQYQIVQWPKEKQRQITTNYLLRWLRFSLLRCFSGLGPAEQYELLCNAVAQIHDLQREVFISPPEQVALLSEMPAAGLRGGLARRLRRSLRDLLPYGYVQSKKGAAPRRERSFP